MPACKMCVWTQRFTHQPRTPDRSSRRPLWRQRPASLLLPSDGTGEVGVTVRVPHRPFRPRQGWTFRPLDPRASHFGLAFVHDLGGGSTPRWANTAPWVASTRYRTGRK